MALIDEAMEEAKAKAAPPKEEGAKAPKAGKPKESKAKAKTREEREAYIARKQAQEEAKYLKMQKRERRKAAVPDRPRAQAKKAEPKAAGDKPSVPKMLQPLEPLYLLKIPGLPKGDCLAICYARGAT